VNGPQPPRPPGEGAPGKTAPGRHAARHAAAKQAADKQEALKQAGLEQGAVRRAAEKRAAAELAAEKQAAAVQLAVAKRAAKPVADPLRVVAADFLAGAGPEGTLPPPIRAEIAFAGRSNVGKSSLINTLVQRRGLVRTGATPGLTRQINVFEARAGDGAVFHLVDLPGYGFARRSKAETASWAVLIEGYLGSRSTLAVVVLIVDVRRGVEEDDQELIDFIDAAQLPSRRPVQVILVATKLDKLPRSAHKPTLDKLRSLTKRKVIGFSAETGEGREELFRTLRRAALGEPAPETPSPPSPEPSSPDQND
jgi:GTP-binding protein